MIWGDPGMGKSRLLNECLERLALAGAYTVVARLLESDNDAPWSALRLLMRSGLAEAPGLAAADPEALAVLASLAPELARRTEPTEPRDNAHVAAALTSLLGAVVEERPLAVAVDDAHFADGYTVGVLGAAIGQTTSGSLILLLAADTQRHDAPRELVKLHSRVGRELPGRSVRLDPLSGEEMRELVSRLAPWCEDPEDLDRLTRRMVLEAGGSPFFAVTLLHKLDRTSTLKDDLLKWPPAGSTFDSPLPFTIPDLARMAIAARISELSDAARDVLSVASIAGLALDSDLIAALAGMPRDRVERLLDELERHRFVTFDGVRYVFTAQLVSQVVRGECLTGGGRRRLRERAVKELAGKDDLGSKLLRAELLAQIGTENEAFDEAVAVAEAALAVGAERTVRRALGTAEQIAAEDGEEMRSVVNQFRLRLES